MRYKKKDINDRILEAGRDEYFAKGFRAGNISAIAANSGVPVGNLYRYFDGKSGLLDAIVKPAYNEIPKLVENLATYDTTPDLEEYMPKLIKELLDAFDRYGKEIIILCDKCATTRYEDFSEKLVASVTRVVLNKISADPNDSDRLMSELISTAFIHSLLDLLRKGFDRATMERIIEKLLVFYFRDFNDRLR
ncbi:MAG: TetR/AcrR family transcriptional regulator [Clostridia bacterium]|nr:TetR/AcrR family transcriptional regulator [Clostridia bacterium]